MNRRSLFVVLLLITLLSCRHTGEKAHDGSDAGDGVAQTEQNLGQNTRVLDLSAPAWYNHPPTSDSLFYGVGVGESLDWSTAERKAIMEAQVQLAEQINDPKTVGNTTTTEATLYDVTVVQKIGKNKGDKHQIYVMLSTKKEQKK